MEKEIKLIKEIRGEYVILDVDILSVCKLKKIDVMKLFDLIRKNMHKDMYFELKEYECEKYNAPIGTIAYTMQGFEMLNIYLEFNEDAVFTILDAFAKKEEYFKVSSAQLSLYEEVIERQDDRIEKLMLILNDWKSRIYD